MLKTGVELNVHQRIRLQNVEVLFDYSTTFENVFKNNIRICVFIQYDFILA